MSPVSPMMQPDEGSAPDRAVVSQCGGPNFPYRVHGEADGTRELVIPNTPYVVPYRVRGVPALPVAARRGVVLASESNSARV
jgi:hypothetical protein